MHYKICNGTRALPGLVHIAFLMAACNDKEVVVKLISQIKVCERMLLILFQVGEIFIIDGEFFKGHLKLYHVFILTYQVNIVKENNHITKVHIY